MLRIQDMEEILKFRGRSITKDDVQFIRKLISENPEATRSKLSRMLCREWEWVQPNGYLRDGACRTMMLALHRADQIVLPEPRTDLAARLHRRKERPAIEVDTSLLTGTIRDLGELVFQQVRRTSEEPLFRWLIENYHYLGFTHPVGEHLKFLVWAGNRPVACFAWSSAPRHLGPRDRYIGWSPEARKKNIRFLAYNTRFLIMPWVRIPHLASHLLGRMAREISGEWEKMYAHPVYYLETFVDTERFRGTCYLASNWKKLGLTTGRGKDDQTNRPNRSLKEVMGLPLVRDFREHLGRVE